MKYQTTTRSKAVSPNSVDLISANKRAPRYVVAVISAFFVLLSTISSATTIVGMDIDEVTLDAELIFEGEVILHESRQNSSSGIISTYVTFNIIEVIKGDYSAESIELKFMGGSFNGQIVEVSGLQIPAEGEQGIYFVESVSRDLVNPLLGWSQGHYIIVDESGERTVNTADRKPVTDVQPMADVPAAIRAPQPLLQGQNEAAAGVVTSNSALRIERALSVEEFKVRIREIIEN